MLLVPYRAEHVDQIRGARMSMPVDRLTARALEGPHAWTVFTDDIEPIAAGGTFKIWERRYGAWILVGERLRGRGVAAVRLVRRYFDTAHPPGRIEAAVENGWTDAHRFVLSLGFEVETPHMPGYLPGGRSAAMYVRVIQP